MAQPKMQSWSEAGPPLRVLERPVSKQDPDPKALRCAGLLEPDRKTIRRHVVDGRPVSHVTTAFLEWLSQPVQRQGQRVLVLIWENASWHVRKDVRRWLQQHHRRVLAGEREGQQGVRLIPCRLLRVPGSPALSRMGCMANAPWWNRLVCSPLRKGNVASVTPLAVPCSIISHKKSLEVALSTFTELFGHCQCLTICLIAKKVA